MVTPKQAIASYALWLTASVPGCDAFSARSLLSRRNYGDAPTPTTISRVRDGNNYHGSAIMMAGFPPPMDGPGGMPPPGMGGGPPMGGDGPGRSFGGPGGMGMGRPGRGGGPNNNGPSSPGSGSYNANSVSPMDSPSPMAGQRGSPGGLGAIASGVSTPMDKYGDRGPTRRPGGYGEGPGGEFRDGRGYGPGRFDERGDPGPQGPSPR